MSTQAVNVSTQSATRSGVVGWIARNRALTAAAAFWVLFAANFNSFVLTYVSDPMRVYRFTERLFGQGDGSADAYQFGLAFAWAPFYLLGKAFVAVTGLHTIGGKPTVPGFVALSAGFFTLGAAAAVVPVLRGLRLPRPALVLLCSVFGTPLFFYGSFHPGHTHAFETLLTSAIVLLLFLYFRRERPSVWWALGIGALLAWLMTVRYFLAADAIAVVAGLLWYRRWRDALLVVATPVAGLALGALVAYETAGDVLQGANEPGKGGVDRALGVLRFSPLNPYRMLFTDHRGLFVWSPVALLGAIGFVILMRGRPRDRAFLSICAAMALTTIASYVLSPYWDGGYDGFDERYLTSFFPFVALGLGGLLEWRPAPVRIVAVVAAAWTLFLGLYWNVGNEHVSRATQPVGSVVHGHLKARITSHNLWDRSNLRVIFPDPYSHG
jgi:hypothetical protein